MKTSIPSMETKDFSFVSLRATSTTLFAISRGPKAKRTGTPFTSYSANNVVEVARRDTKEKSLVSMDGIEVFIENLLEEIQNSLFNRALAHREVNTRTVESYEEFKVEIEKGGFILAHWDGTPETESKVKEETQATIRCISLDQVPEEGKCMVTGNPSTGRVIFAKAY